MNTRRNPWIVSLALLMLVGLTSSLVWAQGAPPPPEPKKPAVTAPEVKKPAVTAPAVKKPAVAAPEKKSDPMSPVGLWKTIDDETGKPKSLVRIVEKGGKLYGRITKLFIEEGEDPEPKCDKCEGGLKDKPIKGMMILKGFKKDDDEWSGGTVLDPGNGKTYKCILQVQDKGRKLKVRGYIGISLIGRTQHWMRVK